MNNEDKERLDWMERNLVSIHCNFCHPDDWTVTIEALGDMPNDLLYHGDTLRDAIDNARANYT